MPEFEHLRHKPPTALDRPRELVLVCAPLAEQCESLANRPHRRVQRHSQIDRLRQSEDRPGHRPRCARPHRNRHPPQPAAGAQRPPASGLSLGRVWSKRRTPFRCPNTHLKERRRLSLATNAWASPKRFWNSWMMSWKSPCSADPTVTMSPPRPQWPFTNTAASIPKANRTGRLRVCPESRGSLRERSTKSEKIFNRGTGSIHR